MNNIINPKLDRLECVTSILPTTCTRAVPTEHGFFRESAALLNRIAMMFLSAFRSPWTL